MAPIKQQEGERAGGGWRRAFGARNLLVASQIALSLGLLTAAGLFTRGALEAGNADPGYRFEGQLVASLDASLGGYDEVRGREVYQRLLDRLRGLPGVRAASLSSTVAFGGFTEGTTVLRAGDGMRDGRAAGTGVVTYAISTDYFRTLEVPILRGRDFTRAEIANTARPAIVIIDEPLARALFPGQEPVGQHIRFARDEEALPVQAAGVVANARQEASTMEVVGVVGGLRHDLFDRAPVAHIYLPFGGAYRTTGHFHVALAAPGSGAEAGLLQAIRREITTVDPRLPVLAIQTLDHHRATSILYWIVRAGANVFSVFGVVAAFLAVVGLYAVKAYVVSRRTREIGIRMALGSTYRGVIWLVLREGVGLTAAGLGIGILIALGIGQLVGSMLYRVSPYDPQVLGLSALLLAGAALVACYLPARRATRVVPMKALRTE
jgi:predicted permease